MHPKEATGPPIRTGPRNDKNNMVSSTGRRGLKLKVRLRLPGVKLGARNLALLTQILDP